VLINSLKKVQFIQHVYATDANFVLVKVENANATYQYLVDRSIIVRNRNTVTLCNDCLRITVGTHKENLILLETLKGFLEE